jgi:phosphoenolpyruvate carboxykinase (ATP)
MPVVAQTQYRHGNPHLLGLSGHLTESPGWTMRPAESFAFVCRDGADSISIALLRSTTEFALTASLNVSLDSQGFATGATIHANLGTAALVEHALRKGEGRLTKDGALLVDTGRFTGRSVKDKYVVRDSVTESTINWGAINQPMTGEHWANLKADFLAAVKGQDQLYVADLFGGSQPEYRVNVRVITQMAWHSLFVRTLLVRPKADELAAFEPEYTIINLPGFKSDPERHGCRSDTVIAVNFTEKLILIGNTEYSGEMKKGVFGLLNFLLPAQGVMPMHCSANIGADGKSAIFFGLSGTGKTTLSADASRTLIGDDEHGWSDQAVFNFEGGCYAKMINLSAEGEPEIYATTKMFGTILENVAMDEDTRELDFTDASKTENTRGAYPIEFIPNSSDENLGPPPSNIILLTADAFGVLPPIARLTPDQAMYHFLSGYTAKVAGTEIGVTEPEATFSTCFGAAFHAAPSQRLRQPAQEADCRRRGAVLAGQHRLVGRQGDRSRHQADADQGHPRAAQRRARRQPQQCRIRARSQLRVRSAGGGAGR